MGITQSYSAYATTWQEAYDNLASQGVLFEEGATIFCNSTDIATYETRGYPTTNIFPVHADLVGEYRLTFENGSYIVVTELYGITLVLYGGTNVYGIGNTGASCISPNYEFLIALLIGNPNRGITASVNYLSDSNLQEQIDLFYNGILPESNDPYGPSGTSDTGGGTGNLDGTSDSIDIPSLPTLTAVDSGFISLFNPTLAQLKSLSSYMWGSLFDLDNFKKLFNDPMECILGLSIVPVNVPSGGAETITVGNLITAVTMNKATTQYVSVDCGSLNVNEYWGAYLDYAPHTKAQIYLPYCGTHDIDVDDIMNKTVHVVYHIDILTGGCVAYVKCGSSVLYEFSGNCATQIPVTNNDFSNIMKSIIDVGVAVGGALATGGMTAPLTMASATGAGAESLAGSSINGGMKPNVQKSGSMSSSIGLMGVQTPYIILTRPRQCVPGRQNEYTGYPSYITETLGSLSGYTEIHSIHLDGIPATDEELNEIESLLYKGVIL